MRVVIILLLVILTSFIQPSVDLCDAAEYVVAATENDCAIGDDVACRLVTIWEAVVDLCF